VRPVSPVLSGPPATAARRAARTALGDGGSNRAGRRRAHRVR
jgi:hypothetical protein